MADLFDALAARALGTAPALAPMPVPRFAPPVDEPEADLDEPPDLAAPPTGDQGRPAVPRTPEPAVSPSRWEEPPAREEPAPTAPVPGRKRSPVFAARSAPAAAHARTERSEQTGRTGRAELPGLVPSRPGSPSPARRPEPSAKPPRGRVPAAPGEIQRGLGQAPSSDGPHPGEPPIGDSPAVRAAERATRLDTPHVERGPGYQPPTAPVQVTVWIGSVHVRAPAKPTPPAPPPQPRRPQPRLSLQDYLRREGP